MKTSKFTKGQKVYYASMNVSRIYRNDGNDIYLCMVIERTVDACGQKQMTFEDDGNDFVFGKMVKLQWSQEYFTTPAEAFAYINLCASNLKGVCVVHPEIMSDKNTDWLEVARLFKGV